jgi:hypothetical protein
MSMDTMAKRNSMNLLLMKGRMHMGKDNFRDTTDISQLPLRTINLV